VSDAYSHPPIGIAASRRCLMLFHIKAVCSVSDAYSHPPRRFLVYSCQGVLFPWETKTGD
jgi:hypothetical protein